MNKKLFTPRQWIIFDYQLGTAIGFADYRGNIPVVVFASDSGETGVIPYEKIENPRKLNIESRQSNEIRKIAETIPNSIICYTKGEA